MGGYLGEFVCEGWSLSKGKGYCSPGSKIFFERPKPAKVVEDDARALARSKETIGPARLVNGKIVHAKGKPVAGKQMTLGSMGLGKRTATAVSTGAGRREISNADHVQPPKKGPAKPQVDQIIRFRNERGFEVGRLSVTQAGFLVHLLDTSISKSNLLLHIATLSY
jgi:DNA repair protein RAD5